VKPTAEEAQWILRFPRGVRTKHLLNSSSQVTLNSLIIFSIRPPFIKKAHGTNKSVKVVIYYTEAELAKVNSILGQQGLENDLSVVLVDARNDNKKSASKIRTQKRN
jgi:hypothetical protein